MQGTRRKPSRQQSHSRPFSPGGDFLFNRTSLLSSALEKLKGNKRPSSSSVPKRVNEEPLPLQNQAPSKKVKEDGPSARPTLAYTPLQKDLYNFYTVNKASLKAFEAVPEPKLDVGAIVLSAICDRGIGGKYLVTSLFRNKKGYIDFADISLVKKTQQASIQALEAYQGPGDFVVGSLVKPRNPGKIQISLGEIEPVNEKMLRVGQVLIGEIRSKEQLGCHLKVKGLKKIKAYLPKANGSEQAYSSLAENKQVVTVIKEIDQGKLLVKVSLISEEEIALNLRGVEQEEMGKLEIEHYAVPGTLVNTKVLKKLSNGLMVKFLKIFIGFVHADHLIRPLQAYTVDEKLIARVIYQCSNPPMLFLSEKHKTIRAYEPQRALFQAVPKPSSLRHIQKAYLSPQEEFFAHPLQLHSEMENLSKFWIKENNYFEGYQIVSSKKLGIKVGDVGKTVPFTNFKVYGEGEGKFRVMCMDVWNKVVKLSYDPKVVLAKNLLLDSEEVDEGQKYTGFINNVNANGVVVEFCNNIRGILSQRELQLNSIQINQTSIGQGIEVYVSSSKKNYLGLTITPPELRKVKAQTDSKPTESSPDSTQMGVILSVSSKSIHPIYIKLKNNKLVKINIFDGIRPASLDDLPIITDIANHFAVGSRVQVFFKKGKYYLYPPEQLSDKQLRFCRVTTIHGNSLRLQTRENEFKNCHICDITDLVTPFPLHEYQVGDYTIGRIVSDKEITLRKSLVLNGLPQTMKDVVQYYSQDEKRGDFRARIEATGPGALKLETVAFGYIKSLGDKGCFISLSRNFDVRVERSEYSDHFLTHPEHSLTPNKLVLCRLINLKAKTGEAGRVQADASLRESVVKLGYPLNDEILETGVGLTVYGMVTGYVKGKALVRLESSKFTGIIALKDVEEASQDQTLEKVLPVGKRLVCKVVEFSRDGEKRLIRLSTLAKVFKKFQGLQTTFDTSQRVVNLWDNFQALSAVEKPEREEGKELVQEEGDGEYERLRKLLAENEIDVEEPQQEQQEQAEEQAVQDAQEGEQQLDEDKEQEQDIEDQADSEQQEAPKPKATKKSAKQSKILKKQEQELKKKVAQFQSLPHPKEFYQSLVLANPTPQSHLLYISSLLPTASPEEIRLHFQRAIQSLPAIADKDNMWISWLNTEQLLGDFPGTVRKAIQANVGQGVHFRILQLLSEQENWAVAVEFGKKMLKKFNSDPRAYISFLRMIDHCARTHHALPDSLSPKEIMKRARQCLKGNEVIQIQIHHARSLFERKESEQGRNVLEELTTRHPKRVDLWSVYVDQETKSGNIDKARNILQRALSIGLKKKSVITLLKKYLALERAHGTEESSRAIIERAKGMAEEYEQLGQEQSEIEDVE